jgi:hypothetical protein
VAPARRIEYWLTVQRVRDGKPYEAPFESSGQEIFENGWRFQLHLESRDPGFLYLINQGLDGEGRPAFRLLFPLPSRRAGSAEVAAGEHLQTASYIFSGESGLEQFWIVWSSQQVPDLEQAKRLMNQRDQGLVQDPVEIARILHVLDEPSVQKPTAVKDRATRRTVVESTGDPLVWKAEFEHHR